MPGIDLFLLFADSDELAHLTAESDLRRLNTRQRAHVHALQGILMLI